jgi:hypothetical protein
MRLRSIVLLVFLFVPASVTSGAPLPANTQPILSLAVKACSLKGKLPAIFFTGMECAPCCAAAESAYEACMGSGATLCQCIMNARSSCIAAGCGPCQCCLDWDTRGVMYRCWEAKK